MPGLFQPPDVSTMYPQGTPQIQTPSMPNSQPPSPNANLAGQQFAMNTPPNGVASTPDANVVDAMDALAKMQLEQKKQYTGNPILDKYIHMFIGQD